MASELFPPGKEVGLTQLARDQGALHSVHRPIALRALRKRDDFVQKSYPRSNFPTSCVSTPAPTRLKLHVRVSLAMFGGLLRTPGLAAKR
jgi:hypothetical protein